MITEIKTCAQRTIQQPKKTKKSRLQPWIGKNPSLSYQHRTFVAPQFSAMDVAAAPQRPLPCRARVPSRHGPALRPVPGDKSLTGQCRGRRFDVGWVKKGFVAGCRVCRVSWLCHVLSSWFLRAKWDELPIGLWVFFHHWNPVLKQYQEMTEAFEHCPRWVFGGQILQGGAP